MGRGGQRSGRVYPGRVYPGVAHEGFGMAAVVQNAAAHQYARERLHAAFGEW